MLVKLTSCSRCPHAQWSDPDSGPGWGVDECGHPGAPKGKNVAGGLVYIGLERDRVPRECPLLGEPTTYSVDPRAVGG